MEKGDTLRGEIIHTHTGIPVAGGALLVKACASGFKFEVKTRVEVEVVALIDIAEGPRRVRMLPLLLSRAFSGRAHEREREIER